jgi:hypothetical protein
MSVRWNEKRSKNNNTFAAPFSFAASIFSCSALPFSESFFAFSLSNEMIMKEREREREKKNPMSEC